MAGYRTGNGRSENLLVAYLRMTLAAQVATLPIILHYFGVSSIITPLTNLAVLWTVPLILQMTVVASVVDLAWNGMGMVLKWLATFEVDDLGNGDGGRLYLVQRYGWAIRLGMG